MNIDLSNSFLSLLSMIPLKFCVLRRLVYISNFSGVTISLDFLVILDTNDGLHDVVFD